MESKRSNILQTLLIKAHAYMTATAKGKYKVVKVLDQIQSDACLCVV